VNPRAIVRLEGLGQFKERNDLVRNRTRQLPACSTVPQPTTLLRAPAKTGRNIQNRNGLFTASGLYLGGTIFEFGHPGRFLKLCHHHSLCISVSTITQSSESVITNKTIRRLLAPA
jgi:hypothetical protein